jgi:hypothetical protein
MLMVSVVELDIVNFFFIFVFDLVGALFLRPRLACEISRVERLLFAPARLSDQILP